MSTPLARSDCGGNVPLMRGTTEIVGWLRLLAVCLVALLAGPALAQSGLPRHHNSIAIVIGNQKYRHTTPVAYAGNDARAMQKYLVERLGFRRGNVKIRDDLGREQMETLFGEPDRADGELMDLILDRRLENRGDVFVFYSGHGVPDPDAVQDDGRRAFLLPVDVRQDRIAAAAFPIDRLHRKLELIRGHLPPDRRVVLMMDACFSGRTPVARGAPGGGDGPDASIFRFSRGSFSVRSEEASAGLIRLVAATGDQVAYWDDSRKLGLFTSLFLRAVGGEADGAEFGNRDGAITGDELARFLEERVPAEARLRHQRTQRPTLEGLELFAWTPAGRPIPAAATPAPAPAPAVRPLPAAAPAVSAPAVSSPVVSAPAEPPAPAASPSSALPAAAATAAGAAAAAVIGAPSRAAVEPVRPEPPKAPVVVPKLPAPAVAARPEPPKPVVTPAPAPKPPAARAKPEEEEEAKPKPPAPRRTARAAPRPVVEEEDEPVRPRVRPRPRPVAEPRPRPAPRREAAPPAPREPSGGGCRVINGVRFCG